MSRYLEHSPLESIEQIDTLLTKHRKLLVFTTEPYSEKVACALGQTSHQVLCGFPLMDARTRARVVIDASRAETAVVLLPVQWVNGYRIDGVDAVLFAGVYVNRNSTHFRSALHRAQEPKVDIYFMDCKIAPQWINFDTEVIFGYNPRLD